MKRWLCAVGLCAILARAVIADEPVNHAPPALTPPAAPAPAAHAATISGRKQVEALLRTPAGLDFGQRKRATVREIFDQLHARHHLSLRFDMPTLTSMLGASANDDDASRLLDENVAGTPAPAMLLVMAPSPVNDGKETAPSPPLSTAPAGGPPSTPLPDGAKPEPPAINSTSVPPSDIPPAMFSPDGGKINSPQPIRSTPDVPEEAPPTPGSPSSLPRLLTAEVDLENLDLSRVSIATVLRQTLDAMPTASLVMDEELAGLPLLLTNATLLDYLVEDDGLLITSRMKALGSKETRVYSLKRIHEPCPDDIAKTIRQSIRPWSWRLQINDLGDQLKTTPLPAKAVASILKTGAKLAEEDFDIGALAESEESDEDETPKQPKDKKSASAEEIEEIKMLGDAMVNSLVTLAQATISSLEMIHYADPPTGTIQAVGKKLVVTQSQAAHREIAELIEQLADE